LLTIPLKVNLSQDTNHRPKQIKVFSMATKLIVEGAETYLTTLKRWQLSYREQGTE
jgi:hypothetical protein